MKRFQHFRHLTAAVVATGIALATATGPAPANASDAGLTRQFSADLHGDVTTTGAALAACATPENCRDTASARLELPDGARVAYARLLWASGRDDCRLPETVPVRPSIGIAEDRHAETATASARLGNAGNRRATGEATRDGDAGAARATVTGEATGDHTAEADVTTLLRGLGGPATVTVAGVRDDTCAAGWSLAVAYRTPVTEPDGTRHVTIHTGAVAASTVTVAGFRRFGDRPARLGATVYGDAVATVNGVPVEPGTDPHVTDAQVPAGAIAEGATSAAVGFGGDALVQQVALSVPLGDLDISASATPERIGPGSTVEYTITVTGNGRGTAGASLRVDLDRALDDATRPFDITASAGRAVYTDRSLKWSGDVAPHGTVTLTYAMSVKNPRPGDGHLDSTVVGGAASNCPAHDPAAECGVRLRFAAQPGTGDDPRGSAPTRLPVTGAPLSMMAGLATAALLAGAALRIAARRHRTP